jgi:hemoglobin
VFVAGAAACGGNALTSVAAAPAPTTSLYQRLGGYDALAAVTDDFLARLTGDADLQPFFAGLEPERVVYVRQMVVDQLCAATGGPCKYVGRSMKESHATLEIGGAAWDKTAGHLVATLRKFNVPSREMNEVLALVGTMRGDIVTKP